MTIARPHHPVPTGTATASAETCSASAPVFNLGSLASESPITSGGSRAERPEEAAFGAGYYRTDISPEALLAALGRLRTEAEAEVERLLAFLDELDGDADVEPTGDEVEPDLGSVTGRRQFDQSHWSAGVDAEPSMGVPERHPDGDCYGWGGADVRRDLDGSQAIWGCVGNFDDREESEDVSEDDSHDGREPDVCDEPSLGSFDRLTNQEHAWRQTAGGSRSWLVHNNSDVEADPAP